VVTGSIVATALSIAVPFVVSVGLGSREEIPPIGWFSVLPLVVIAGATAGVMLAEWLRGREVLLDSAQRHVRMNGYAGRGSAVIPYRTILAVESLGGPHDLVALHLGLAGRGALRIVFPDPIGRAATLLRNEKSERTAGEVVAS